jgi:hypothetical protein
MTFSEIKPELMRAIEECRGLAVPQTDFDELVEFVEEGEPEVAFTFLTSKLVDSQVVVSKATYETLAKVGSAMRINPLYWSGILTK